MSAPIISMKKLVLLLFVLALVQFKAHAQEPDEISKLAFSVGPELVIPARSTYSIGYGASAKFEIPVAGDFSATLTGAYQALKYKGGLVAATESRPNATFIPLKAGVRYWAGESLCLEAEGGDVIETQANILGSKRNLFAFSFGPVFLLKLSGKQNIDLGFRYEQWSQGVVQQTTIRVAYRIGW